MTSTETKIEYGLRYPNGPYDWVLQNVTNLLDADNRDSMQKAYNDQMAAFGIEAKPIEWVQRTVAIQYGDPEPMVEPETPEDLIAEAESTA